MRHMFRLAAVAGCLVALAAPAGAANPARGKSLYETRCWVCHETSVHSRKPQAARSFDDIRAFVVRWDKELGGGWTSEDITDVTMYLNYRYYTFPCPRSICPAEQASAGGVAR